MADTLILIGGGEHAAVVAEAAQLSGWHVSGYLAPEQGNSPLQWLGTDSDIRKHLGRKFVCAAGSTDTRGIRRKIVSNLGLRDEDFATIIHPSAIVSRSAQIWSGVVILANAVVNPNASVFKHAIINTASVIEHDVSIGAFTHVSPGAVIGGGAKIGSNCHVGLGSRVRDHISIADDCLVGMGAVVTQDITEACYATGVPARPRAQ